MKRYIYSALLVLISTLSAHAQGGRIVSDIELLDIHKKVATLPYFGSRNLLIFYVDPDRIGQNDAFVQELKTKEDMRTKNLYGMTILNAKDGSNIPERLLYNIARKRAEATGFQFFIDDNNRISSAWRLGDCNDLSTVIVVGSNGEMLFINRGKIADEDKQRFYRVIEGLK